MPAPDVSGHDIASLMSLTGRPALVTGGARGAGLAIAHRLAEAGASVAIGDLHQDDCDRAALDVARHGTTVVGIEMDVSSTASVAAATSLAAESLGGLAILVNNAGIYPQELLAEVSDELWNQIVDVNLTGPLRCARAAHPYLQSFGWGSVMVNVLSTAAFSTKAPGNGPYSAAKFGLNGLTKALALQFATAGIRVLGVAPTVIDTPGFADAGHGRVAAPQVEEYAKTLPLGRVATPDDVARAVLYCVSDMSMMLTGSALLVDGGALI